MEGNQARAFIRRKDHEHNTKDDFRTPAYLINYLCSRFGKGLRDGACSEENKKGEPINVFGFHLIEPKEWIYVNPPFDTPSIVAFVDACSKLDGNDRVFLLPNKLCQKRFVESVNAHFDEIIMLGGRINFESPYAVKGGTSMNGCFFGIMYADPMKKNEFPIVKSITLAKLKEDFSCPLN